MNSTRADKATGCVVAVAQDFSKDEILPFAQYVVDGKRTKLAGPFWTYGSAELACRTCRHSNPDATIVRADDLE